MSAIALRASIDELVAHRNRALAHYASAYEQISEGHAAVGAAAPSGRMFTPPMIVCERNSFGFKSAEEFMTRATAEVDRAVWSHLIEAMGFERLMDSQARDEFRRDLQDNPPPVTADNCRATMEQLLGDADLIFKRGIANAFSKLDRRFRSHDGFKLGARIVLTSAFSEFGSWNSYRRQDEVIRDIERTFHTLEGKPLPERYGGIIGAIDEARKGSRLSRQAFEVTGDYFRLRAFKNGNAHLWFTRDDLVERVNLILADYYGAALGAGADVADQDHVPSGRVAKNFGLFETPEAVADRLFSDLYIKAGAKVLEPSAGSGRLAKRARAAGGDVLCIEIQPRLVEELRAADLKTVSGDFLAFRPQVMGKFDFVIMNPPFDRGLDVEHVTHAIGFLAPGGQLTAIMAAGVEFREDARTAAFRSLVDRFGGTFRDLPPASFAEAGTNVNTCILTLRAPR